MKNIYTALTIVALLVSTAAGQASRGDSGVARSRGAEEIPSLGRLTIDMSGIVLQTDVERKAIQIRTKQNQRERDMGLALDPKCKITADKKQFGKKDLTLDELQPGYEVKMIVRRADMLIIEMKVKKPKET